MSAFEEMQVEQIKKHIHNLNFSVNSLIELAKFCGELVDKKVKEGTVHGRTNDRCDDRLKKSRETLECTGDESCVCVSGELYKKKAKGKRFKAVASNQASKKRG